MCCGTDCNGLKMRLVSQTPLPTLNVGLTLENPFSLENGLNSEPMRNAYIGHILMVIEGSVV